MPSDDKKTAEAFYDELTRLGLLSEKTATAVAKKERSFSEKNPHLSKWLTGTAAGTGLNLVNQGLVHATKTHGARSAADAGLMSAIRANTNIPIHETDFPNIGAFVPEDNVFTRMQDMPGSGQRVILDHQAGPATLAHELGHADLHNSRAGRLLQNKATMLLGGAGPALGGTVGFASGLASDDPSVHRWAVAAPALAALPQLGFEAGASILGMKRMRAAGASRGQMLQGLKALVPAFGSYATRAAAGSASAYAAQGVGHKIREMTNGKPQEKTSAVSDDHARRAIDQLDALERNKPTLGQVGRYAGLGAVAGPVVGALGNAIRGGREAGAPILSHLAGAKQPGMGGVGRALASAATVGAIGSGLVPLVRGQLDRAAAMGTLKDYLAERAKEEASPMMKGEQQPILAAEPKLGFQVSQYSGPLSYGPFKQESRLAPFKQPSLATPVEKKAAPTTPAGLLSMSRGVGYPKVTTPGGSIAALAKPKGFGKALPGAKNPNSLL